jgi:glycosyltransferase involved in cell wall biosynthesis
MKKKILFVAPHRLGRNPCQRFRFEQYLKFFENNGFETSLSYIITKEQDEFFYKPGHYLKKLLVLIKGVAKRISDIKKVRQSDIVFVQREAFMTSSTFFEKQFKKTGTKFIFDFDDAIWLPNVSDANKNLEWLKDSKKTSKIIKIADFIIAGNAYLADYAKQFNSNVFIIPTTVETNVKYQKSNNTTICIGWSGSTSTIKHFELAIPVLLKIKEKYGHKVKFKVIGQHNYQHSHLDIQFVNWTAETEIKELEEIDIGIMPLPDDEWAKGKCGLKGLQFMALEIPVVMAAVGVNKLIIKDGENGLLAISEKEWVDKISLLIESEQVRNRIGAAGRKTVVQNYSVISQQQIYLDVFKKNLN